MADLEGEISITSHFVGFRVSPLFAAKVHTVLICSCRVARELLIVCMSSAWMKPPAYMSPTDGPRPLFCKDFKRGSIISRKRTGERTDPWRTPCSRVSGEDSRSFTLSPCSLEMYTSLINYYWLLERGLSMSFSFSRPTYTCLGRTLAIHKLLSYIH